MTFTYYGHSCFLLSDGKTRILFDPFISGNELAHQIHPDQIETDYILISHAHADHIADAESIALRTGAKVICSWEIHEWLNGKGVHNTYPMNTGGQSDLGDFHVRCTVAQHSSGLPDGSYGGNPMGFVVTMGEESVYYSGDTALTLDMQLIPIWAKLKAAILPIGDHFTMGADDAIRAAGFVQCNNIIGVHFDTFGFIRIDHEQTKQKFEAAGLSLRLPAIGSEIEL
jgi:L-ascorbate metabolism protein UlaG (beta-lactamase superfamily)